jgi:hypothetical protein
LPQVGHIAGAFPLEVISGLAYQHSSFIRLVAMQVADALREAVGVEVELDSEKLSRAFPATEPELDVSRVGATLGMTLTPQRETIADMARHLLSL